MSVLLAVSTISRPDIKELILILLILVSFFTSLSKSCIVKCEMMWNVPCSGKYGVPQNSHDLTSMNLCETFHQPEAKWCEMFYVYIHQSSHQNKKNVTPCVSPRRPSVRSAVGVATTSPVAQGHAPPRYANEDDSHPAWLAWFQVWLK